LASNAASAVPTPAADPLLQVDRLQVMYGGIVGIRAFSLDVEPGHVVALLGPNGAGKSSALKGICGEGDVTGKVRFDGKDASRWAPHRRARHGLIQVPQGGGLFREMSVLENLMLGGYGRSREERHESLERVFTLFPKVEARKDVQAGMMSGGEQQMLALGRALMGNPKLMLLDEPTIGLAPSAVTEVFERIGQIAATGVSLIIVDQNAMQALKLADWVCVVNRGKIVYSAPKAQAVEEVNIVDAHLGLVSANEAAELTDSDDDDSIAADILFDRRPIGERLRRGALSFFR
jgi:branched-chain amino acid transport system ATP-binding protein